MWVSRYSKGYDCNDKKVPHLMSQRSDYFVINSDQMLLNWNNNKHIQLRKHVLSPSRYVQLLSCPMYFGVVEWYRGEISG